MSSSCRPSATNRLLVAVFVPLLVPFAFALACDSGGEGGADTAMPPGDAGRDGGDDAATDTGAGSDAAAGDAATDATRDGAGDAAFDAGGGACPAHPSELFCDDFESGAIDDARYETDLRNGGAAAIVEAPDAVSGARVLEARVGTDNGSRAMVAFPGVLPVTGNRFFGRAHMHFAPQLPMMHAYLIEARGMLGDDNTRYRLDSNNGRINSRYMSRAADAIQHGGFRKMGGRPAADTWICVEWEFDGAGNAQRWWFDGAEDEEMRVDGTEDPQWTAPQFTSIAIGFHSFQAAEPGTVVRWDDVAIATERVGCE